MSLINESTSYTRVFVHELRARVLFKMLHDIFAPLVLAFCRYHPVTNDEEPEHKLTSITNTCSYHCLLVLYSELSRKGHEYLGEDVLQRVFSETICPDPVTSLINSLGPLTTEKGLQVPYIKWADALAQKTEDYRMLSWNVFWCAYHNARQPMSDVLDGDESMHSTWWLEDSNKRLIREPDDEPTPHPSPQPSDTTEDYEVRWLTDNLGADEWERGGEGGDGSDDEDHDYMNQLLRTSDEQPCL